MIGGVVSSSGGQLQFEIAGSVPGASSQSTSWGKTPQGLTYYNGKIYGGYGDWNANSGPIIPWAYDINTDTISASGYSSPTENLSNFRVIDGVLWAPLIDPRGGFPNNYLSRFTEADGWSTVNLGSPGLHLFDIAKHGPSGKLIAVGSRNSPDAAIAYESDDNGESWSISYTGPDLSRFYSIQPDSGDWDNDDLVTRSTYGSYAVFNGSSWSTSSPTIQPLTVYSVVHEFNGRLVTWTTSGFWIDGNSQYWVPNVLTGPEYQIDPAAVWYDERNDYLYVVIRSATNQEGVVRRAKLSQINSDIDSFYQNSAPVPSNLESLGIGVISSSFVNTSTAYDGVAYIGDTESRLWKVSLPLN